MGQPRNSLYNRKSTRSRCRGFNRSGAESSPRASRRLRASRFRRAISCDRYAARFARATLRASLFGASGRSTTDRIAAWRWPRLASIFTCPGRLPASADRLNPKNKSCNAAAPFYDIVNAHGGIVCQEDIIMKNTEQRIGKTVASMASVSDGGGREVASGM